MAVPSSGELELRGDIALEVYGNATGTNISLRAMSDLAGFSSPDAMSEFYGYSSYTAPTVNTSNATSVTASSMTLNGTFSVASGSPSLTQYGFYFGTSTNMTSNTRYSGATVSGSGFSLARTGLTAGTTYYIWAFVVDSVQETTGSMVTQATSAAFSPTYLNYNTASTQFGFSNSQLSSVSATHYYYNPDTSSYVSFATVGHTSRNQMVSVNNMPTKTGQWNKMVTNANSKAVLRTSSTTGAGGTDYIGFTYNAGSAGIEYWSDTSYPKYWNPRAVSGSSPGFTPNVVPDNFGVANVQVRWSHNTKNISTNFVAGAYFESIFTFFYNSTPG